ncbi:unnamed protein product [Paramecium octaurelia]|uniref:MSP domain-containing protein n=1 Tax=Paramecium octaurelia TaxID=43137 RepID=A0A8S1Y0C2_PAROT|nr:unnamed protein product [Paramecium octaurelia]
MMQKKLTQTNRQAKTQEFTPSQLIQKQLSGQIFEDAHPKIKIIEFQNLADFSSQPVSSVPIDEPLFDPIPPIIQFTDYEPLQIKEKIFKLRNKDRVARRVKIYKPDSRLFQVVAPGMETNFIIRFSPESKSDYNYDVIVETEREKFVVPIVAVGKRAMIDFPDSLDFGNCPVKYTTEKPVIIRNLGEKTTKWFLKLPLGFDADKREGVLEYGKNEQIVIKFFPTEARSYKNKAILQYDNMEAYVPIIGVAHNGNVYLSKSQINMTEAFIGLQLQQTLQIINKSNVKVDFEWRAFATEKEEQEKKNRLRNQLEEEEAEERMLIKELVSNEGVHEELELEEDEDSEEEERDEKAIILKRQKKAELQLARKYRNIRKAIEDDLLLFIDDIFTIEPTQGQIWPNSEMTVTVTFVPRSAFLYQTVAYCNISCSEERLPLNLYGQGMGPRAFLSVYEVNLGDVFVNEIHKTEVVIENRGEIECKFELMPNERAFGKMFKFDVERGVLAVGQRMPFTITFKSSIPGEFKETFRWKLEGSTDQLTILFIGHVIAPTFNFQDEKIQFGTVSYSFEQTKTIKMTNTSTVAFTYELKIPGDGKLAEREFEIEPRRNTIQPKNFDVIKVTFIPKQIKTYEQVMVVDIEGVGQDMLSIPITADCQAPRVELRPSDRLNFNKGDDQKVFLRNPCKSRVDLINTSELPAKFVVLPQNDEYKVLADYTVEPSSGKINGNSTMSLEVTLTTKKLYDITLPLQINIVGTNNGQPHVITIVAFSEGPKVKTSKTELDFGNVEVLKDYSLKLTLTNDSDIEADFHAFTKNKVSIFKPIQKHGIIKPKESCEIEVLCSADDAVKVSDVLHFVIKEGDDVEVQLKAKGIGSTIFCKDDLSSVNMGVNYTHRKVTKEIFVENKGRKQQKLQWTQKKPQQKKEEQDQKNNKAPPPPEEESVFSIAPDTIVLPPKHGIMFQFRGYSQKKGKISEIFMLNSTIGSERKANLLFATTIEGDFIQPTLQFSERKLFFKYSWEKNVPFMPISKNLEITCACPLPVNFDLKCQQPFTVNQDKLQLNPGKSAVVRIDFDPAFKSDRKSGDLEGKLQLSHYEHPHKDLIDLIGQVHFPNLIMETNLINFGSILYDTTKKMVMTMKNQSEMALNYEWTFVSEELSTQGQQPNIPINEIFDILPLSGYMEPGSEEQVEFVYNAIGGQRFKTTAVCHVDGGPEYEVTLVGDSSLLSSKMSTTLIELGDVRFCEWVSREFTIENTGKVTFEFKIDLRHIKKKGFVDVQPQNGKIAGGEKLRITVRVSPVIPAEFKEIILVQIGYYEPEPITIIGRGVYPSMVVQLPRSENPLFQQKFDVEIAKKKADLETQTKRAQLIAKTQNQKVQVKTLEQVQLEVERDIDRFVFCEQIKRTVLDKQDERTHSRDQKEKFYDNVILATYICDFGNVVLNSIRQKTITINNPGTLPVEFVLDGKYFKPQGYNIVPERVLNLPSGANITLNIQYQTKKNMGFGPTKTVVPIELKKGPKFHLELVANITIPQIVIENSADGQIDFGKVLIGQKKIIFLRFVNDKEIDCEWSQSTRQELTADKKEEPRFVLVPNSGIIKPGDKQLVEAHFTPLVERNYSQKFTLNIKENATPYILNLKGTGTSINLQFNPQLLNIGPILPYDKFAHSVLEIKNPTEFDTELFSLDFDTQYLQDDEIVNSYPQLEHTDFILMPVRQPGQPIWLDFQKAFTRSKRKDQILNKLQDPNVENKEQLQKELDDIVIQETMIKVEYPKKVSEDVLKNIVIMGPPKCGKTHLANYLEQTHRRKVINMNELVQWNQENQTQAYQQLEQYLQQRQNEIQFVQQEREKLLKKAGKKSKDLEDKWGPIPLHLYEYLSEEIIVKLLKARLAHEDCGAGAIFDNLQSKYWPNELYLMKCIMEIDSHLQVVVLKEQYDQYGFEIQKLIEWPGMEKLAEEDKPKKEEIVDPIPTSKDKNNKTQTKRGKEQSQSVTKKQEKPLVSQLQLQQQQQQSRQKSRPKSQPKSAGNLVEQSYYDVFYPASFEDEIQKQNFNDLITKVKALIENKYHEKIEIATKIHDPVFDEGKKEEKPQKPAKKGDKPPEPEEPKVEIIDYTYLQKGERQFNEVPFHYNLPQLCQTGLQVIPAPIYPNPNSLPIPDPIYHQIVMKKKDNLNQSIQTGRKKTDTKESSIHQSNATLTQTLKYFNILTPKDMYVKDFKMQSQQKTEHVDEDKNNLQEEQNKHLENINSPSREQLQHPDQLNKPVTPSVKARANVTSRSIANVSKRSQQQKNADSSQGNDQKYNYKLEDLIQKQYRWSIPAGRTLILVIQFFTKHTGSFEGRLNFDNFFSIKKSAAEVKGVADYPSLSGLPKQLFWTVKKARPANAPDSYLSKVYVQNEQSFDFGPLLIGKSDKVANRAINSTTFRLSNSGKFDTELQFSLLSSIQENKEIQKGVFTLDLDNSKIQMNSVPLELRVWAFPDKPQKFRDDLIVQIKDNPLPLIIPMVCIGCRPTIDLVNPDIKFERLLISQSDSRTVTIKNTGMINAKWKLTGIEQLEEEFQVINTSGELAPTMEAKIEIRFRAIKERKLNLKITLEVEDVENMNIKQDPKIINVDAEAFQIQVDIKYPSPENILDFGSVKVGDFKDQVLQVKNIGQYLVKIKCLIKKKLFPQLFQLEPMETDLNPGQQKDILIRFCGVKEIKMKTTNDTTDLYLEILEGKTQEIYKPVPINVQFNSVYSKYSINPLKNINFGPIQFNESKVRHLEIKNEGQFEFNFTIFDYANEEFRKQLLDQQTKEAQEKKELMKAMPSSLAPVDPKKGPKKDDKKQEKKQAKPGKNDPPPGQLKIGQWTIMPSIGTIAPDSSCTVEITFAGQGQKNYEQKLAIDIINRNPEDQPNGIEYEVLSESCIPGISTTSYESIFEEQVVLQSQVNNLSNLINSNVFFIEEKVFSFGTLVPSKVPDGVVERFKLTNPNKIPCSVKLDARRRQNYPNDNFAFEVFPKQVKIAPHESVYIKVAFKPTIMAQYYGIFEAIVENGEQSPKTHKLLFDLRGEGALPTLKLEKPKDWLDERTPVVKFGRVRLGKTLTMPIVLKNDGQIPATVKWDLTAVNEHFRFLDQNTFTLTPKTTATFNIEFTPKDVGVKQHYFVMQTLLNPYEVTKVAVTGEAFQEDIVFENLDDEVQFGDCIINTEKKIQFFLKNNGANTIRFQWNTQGCEDFTFIPRQGHLNTKESKPITLIFKSNRSIIHKSYALQCDTKQINKKVQSEWDDSMATTKYVTLTEYNWLIKKREEEEARRLAEEAANKKGAKKVDKKTVKQDIVQPPQPEPGEEANIPISDPLPEPEYQVIDKSDKSMPMKVNAIADFAKYEIDQRSVYFKETLMYTTRVHQLKLKNTSLIAINYSCKIVSAQTGAIDPGYFYVYPKQGKIASNSDEMFTIKFSPTEVDESNERLLVISIDNLDPNQEKLIVELDGQAERPICHFELPPSNYRDKKPDLEAKYNVIEFESLGCKVKNTKRFYVVNPTSVGYEYEWKRIDDEKNQNANYFKCITIKGVVLSGKKSEIIFEYSPDTQGQHESYWVFEIPQEHIIQYFLVTGSVVEPNVIFNVGKVNFGPLLVQGKNKETVILKNLEDVPLTFQFDRESFHNPEFGDSLTITPVQGTIKALGDQPIEIQFAPKVEREYNYNLLCNVKRRQRPVTLNVKGIGYILHNNVYLNGVAVTQQNTVVELGDLYINEKSSKQITVENQGDFNFDFSVRKSAQLSNIVIINPENGTVKKNEKFNIEIRYQPTAPQKLNQQFSLCISSGPTYNFQLIGSAKKPAVEFSFLQYDFGPCFVLRQPLPITKHLELRNRDVQAMAIEALYEKKPYFGVQLPSGQVLLPIQIETHKDKKGIIQTKELNVLQIPITFTPRELVKYDESVIFDINGLQKVEVRFTGEGVPLKLDLLKTEYQFVDFGIYGVGQIGTEVVSLVNNSQKMVTLIFEQDLLKELKQKYFIKVRPKKEFVINPRERKEITLTFKPQQRLHSFKTDLFFKIVENNEVRKLLTLQGACHGIELKLMEDTIGFGGVVINSRLTKNVQLSNLGDVAAKFQWDTSFCKNYFTITPLSGTLPAHEDLQFQITFHPNAIDNDIRFDKVKCLIQNSDPLYLNLLGKCIEQPKEQIQEVKFETVVRVPTSKKVTVKNPTPKPWKVKASVSALLPQFKDYFEGKEYIEVPANGQAEYEVVYKPLTMTSNPQIQNLQDQHEGSLFFPLPDGQALLYNLFGKSLPPLPQTVDTTMKAKKNTTQVLQVKNWLKTSQRFEVTWTLEPEDPSIILNGANTFEVSSEGTKDYKLTIYGLKQSQNKVTVYFRNAITQEFVFFKINLTIQPPDQLPRIELTSIVREVATKLITIENPINQPVEFKKDQLIAETDSISFNPQQFVIPPKSEFGLEIAYRPLVVQDIQSKITIKSVQLGEFVYPLKLQGLQQNVSRSLYFKASLGTEMVLPFKFMNYTKKPTMYTCYATKLGPNGKPLAVNIDPKAKGAPAQTTDFICEQVQFQAPQSESFDGVECQISVKYEPSSLNESRGILVVQSPDGGEYQCLLIGQGITPQPKGPYKLSGAKPPAIEFKNPFFEAQEFTLRIDNPAFTSSVKSPIKVDGKKVLSINITYKAVPNTSNNGRLIISCGDLPQWVFYLQGE